MVKNEDRTLAIVGYYRVLNGVNQPYSRVRLQGLDPDMVYENVWNHTENYGDELMNYGLITSDATAGEVQRVEVLEHHETPGLGDKIDRNKGNWLDSFTHKHLQNEADSSWAVKKDGGQFDSFTGATITPRAIVKQLKNVLLLVRHPEVIEQAPACKAE
jgi:hypothetical protein